MTSFESKLTKIIKSRGITWLLIAVSLTAACISYTKSLPEEGTGSFGLLLPSPELWFNPSAWVLILNIIGAFLCAFLMVAINRTFNLLRTVSDLFVGLFFLMQAASPVMFSTFSGGVLLATFVFLSMLLLYSIYHNPDSTRSIFLIFFLLAFGCLWEYGFIFYLIAFMAGCSQMRVISARSLPAIALGIVTPVWILWGFGCISFSSIHSLTYPDVRPLLDPSFNPQLTLATIITLILGFVTGTMNVIKVISFNNQSRAFFVFLSMTGILSGFLAVFNFNNVLFYSPLLYGVTSMQICMAMRLYEKSRAYVLFPVVLVLYSLIFVWTVA